MIRATLRPDGIAAGEEADERDGAAAPGDDSDEPPREERLRALLAAHFDFIWRSLRRLGLSEDRADDAAQQVFVIASNKLEAMRANSERSFLFGIALRVASDIRRSATYRREIPHEDPGADLEGGARPDDLVEQRRARALLDATLETMTLELRSVFILFEIEEMTTAEIATLLEIPTGTVASRLRRARDEFAVQLEKVRRSSTHRPSHGAPEGGAA